MNRYKRSVIGFATTALIVAPLPSVHAQGQADPPSRVGRVAVLQSTVFARAAGATAWAPAMRNDPVFEGQSFRTEPKALAELQVAASSFWLDGGTELDIDRLDQQHFAATEPEGETFLDLRDLAAGETYTVQTPRGLVSIVTAGRYDVIAGDADQPTMVSVLDGRAEVTGPTLVLSVPAGRTATITGAQAYLGSVGPLVADAFATAVARRDRMQAASLPPQVASMTGCEDLAQYGTWQSTPDDGDVWYPQVAAGWAPYQDGSWSFIAPWGWTWVDDAPWGFAPFHYGRWIEHEGRWGWVPRDPGLHPGAGERPVYAPALVAFFGLGAVAAAGAAATAAFSHGHIGWVPLGPREPYFPAYHASERYLQRLNAFTVPDAARLTFAQGSGIAINHLANVEAAHIVPAEVIAGSRPVAGALLHMVPSEYARGNAVFERPPLAPGPGTRGITPVVARSFGFTSDEVSGHPAPGPQIVSPATPPGPPHQSGVPPLRPASISPRSAVEAPNERQRLPAILRPSGAGETGAPLLARPEPPHVPGVIRPNPAEPPRAPAAPELARPELARPELARPEMARPELARPESPRPEPSRPEPPRAELPRVVSPRPELRQPEAARPEPPRAEPPRAEVQRAEPRAAPRMEMARPAPPHPPAPSRQERP